jgi:Carboxypeptidase regulatory-like domain
VWIAIVTGGPCLEAQATRDVSLTVQVTDISSAVIPRAHITLIRDETTETKVEADTDENGYAGLSVKPGSYRLSVASPGFSNWHKQIDVGDAVWQKIEAELKPGSCPPGPCVTVSRGQQWLDQLMPISSPLDSVWVEER